MKKLLYTLAPALLFVCSAAIAQDTKKETKKEKKEIKKEIVIEEKAGGKSEKMTIVVDGDKVTINGKPADEYKGKKHIVIGDDVVISGDAVHIPRSRRFNMQNLNENFSNKAMLGVVTEGSDNGAKIKKVIKESPAEKAGLKEGDIITKVNDTKIAEHKDLVNAIGKLNPDDVANVTYLRDGKESKVKTTLAKNKSQLAWSYNYDNDFNYHMSPPMAFNTPRGRMFGFGDDDMWVFRSDRPRYGMSIEDYADGDGVKVNDVEEESNAAKAGLKKDDVITEVEGNAVKGVDALREALSSSKDKQTISMKVLRNGSVETLTVRVPKVIKKAEL